jgi:hypothetical protein
VLQGAQHQHPAEATTTADADGEDAPDRGLGVLRARLEQPSVRRGLALQRRPGREVKRALVEPVDVEVDAVLLDREHLLARHVDRLQLTRGQRIESGDPPDERKLRPSG